MELAKAYVQIVPSAEGISGSISKALGGEASSAGDSAGAGFGSSMVSAIKKVVAVAGIGKIFKDSISEGAALEQSIGGIETLYKESADTMKQYAQEAYKTAGISANSYMEQSTSFAAALLSSLGGDTAKAAEAANTAIIDMADNSNKMGTSLESIQNAYQGFAKGNYTMLDNLKLGYGGTKTEMERLLADASKLSGVKYDLSNLSDVYSAIHVIQEELDITGTTAKEASTTLSGSMASMKSAFTNLLGNLALGESIQAPLSALFDTFRTFFENNLIPMIKNVLSSVPELVSQVLFFIVRELNIASQNADEMVAFGIDLVTNLVTGIVESLPYLMESSYKFVMAFADAIINTDWLSIATNLVSTISEYMNIAAGEIFGTDTGIIESFMATFTENYPLILEKVVEILTNVSNYILENIPMLLNVVNQGISMMVEFISANLPVFLEKGSELLMNIVNGIVSNLPAISQAALEIFENLLNAITTNLPQILLKGVEVLKNLLDGIIQALPQIITTVVTVIAKIVASIGDNLPKILQSGLKILEELIKGILQAIPQLIAALPKIFTAIVNAFKGYDWLSIGKGIIDGIKNGIVQFASNIADAAKEAARGAVDGVKSFLGIHSPSTLFRDQVGANIDKGLALGIKENAKDVYSAMNYLSDAVIDSAQMDVQVNSGMVNSKESTSEILAYLKEILPALGDKNIYIDGDKLVGATIDKIDNGLGFKQSNIERGVYA